MSETPKPDPEQSRSPETTSTSELDRVVDRILIDYGATKHEDADESRERLFSKDTGTELTRSIDPEGNVTYSVTMLWHATTDRGSWTRTWTPKATSIQRDYHSEMEGTSAEEPGGGDYIESMKRQLERDFPAPVEAETDPKENAFKRLMGSIALQRSRRKERKEQVRRANENLRASGYTGRKLKGF